MRNPSFRAALAGALLATTALCGAASAQTNPSAQQIINQLKPSGMLSDTTRGIKPLPPGPSGTVAPAMPVTPAASSMSNMSMAPAATPATPTQAATATAPSTNLDIQFGSGSASLTPEATAALDQLGKALTSADLAAYNFKIVGHTDTTGDAATNQTLSEQRAAAVKSYLETKFGVADTRLQSEGVGESDLLVPTPPNTPDQRNRRVQIINLGQ
ncbi:membrane protein [Acidocella aquatica]|uniref:Membrane protein n=1 Tax=Acidocella aquatica TaxID=1922313 RepID=A0ABQ6A520_9PROT|nr:OmpA family protein [Acidocella aquatica]GLR65647.1 membrane protein [Acidocella aquatica]